MHPWEKSSAAASSASINKTLQDIDAILDGVKPPQGSKKREELRARIREALTETALKWLKDGFRGGHVIAVRTILESERIPLSISRTASRQLPNGDTTSKIVVRSELPVDLVELVRSRQTQPKPFLAAPEIINRGD